MTERGVLACAVLITKDEDDILADWLAYYGALLGPENIYVVDNGTSSAAALDELAAAKARGSCVVRDVRPFCDAVKFMSEHMRAAAAARRPRWLMPLETDEFVFRLDRAGNAAQATTREDLQAALEGVPDDVSLLRYGVLWGSVVDPTDARYRAGGFRYRRPAAEMTRFYNQGWDKLMVRACAFQEMTQWCHNARVSGGREQRSDLLGLLHFHDAGVARSVARAVPVAEAYGYVDRARRATPSELLLQAEYWRGAPVTCGHKVDQYAAHLRRHATMRAFRRYLGRLPTSVGELDAFAARDTYLPMPPPPSAAGGCGGCDFVAALVRRELATGTLSRAFAATPAFEVLLHHEEPKPHEFEVTHVANALRALAGQQPAPAPAPAPAGGPSACTTPTAGRVPSILVLAEIGTAKAAVERVQDQEQKGGTIEMLVVPDGASLGTVMDAVRCTRQLQYDHVYDARKHRTATASEERDILQELGTLLISDTAAGDSVVRTLHF